jgi:LruC domain-containing protein
MKKSLLFIALLGAMVTSSCRKSLYVNPDSNSGTTTTTGGVNDIKVPAGFNWASTRSTNFAVSVNDTRFANDATHSIAIYDADPYNGGKLLARGSAKANSPFVTKISLSTQLKEVYVQKSSPDNSSLTQVVQLSGGDINLTLGYADATLKLNSTNKKILATAPASPDCNSGCTLPVVTASKGDIDLNNGDVLCITGSNITVSFRNVNGGTVRVCGTNVTLQNLNLSGSAELIVASGGSVNISSLNFNSSTSKLTNFGRVAASSSFALGGIINNYGTMSTGGDFNLNSNSTFYNGGTLTVGGSFQNGTSNVAINDGAITVGGNFQPNSNSTFVNNCSLTVGGNYNQSALVKNYSLITVGGTSTLNDNVELDLYNGAMLVTKGLIVNGTIKGYGGTSLVKITGTTAFQNSGAIVENVQVWAVNGISNAYSNRIKSGAVQDNSVYIPATGCNTTGNGSPAIADADGDSVADDLDDYPNDASRAYNNYYPNNLSTGATVAFEDQWPYKGDYDLNDVVVTFKYNVITNGQNKVVQVAAAYNLMATGGNLGNGFGVQFPVSRSAISNLSGATLEANQSKAVIILFTNMRSEMATWNTKTGDALTPAKTYNVTFNVTNGPALQDFGLNEFNPFIWNDGLGSARGREIHLPGKVPTDLADQSLFGTQEDNTNLSAGRYYITKTGLPYGLTLPVSPFGYPTEGVDVTKAYLHFGDWAVSGGALYTDWYSNAATGYRDINFIFK